MSLWHSMVQAMKIQRRKSELEVQPNSWQTASNSLPAGNYFWKHTVVRFHPEGVSLCTQFMCFLKNSNKKTPLKSILWPKLHH